MSWPHKERQYIVGLLEIDNVCFTWWNEVAQSPGLCFLEWIPLKLIQRSKCVVKKALPVPGSLLFGNSSLTNYKNNFIPKRRKYVSQNVTMNPLHGGMKQPHSQTSAVLTECWTFRFSGSKVKEAEQERVWLGMRHLPPLYRPSWKGCAHSSDCSGKENEHIALEWGQWLLMSVIADAAAVTYTTHFSGCFPLCTTYWPMKGLQHYIISCLGKWASSMMQYYFVLINLDIEKWTSNQIGPWSHSSLISAAL